MYFRLAIIMWFSFVSVTHASSWTTSFPLAFKTYFQNNPADQLAFRTELNYGRSLKQNEKWQALGRVGQHFSIVESKTVFSGTEVGPMSVPEKTVFVLGGVRFDLATTMDNNAYSFSHFQIFTLDGRFGLFFDFKKEALAAQLAFDHWSAHYVDGSSISLIANRPTYSFEDVKLSLNYDLNDHLKLFGQLATIVSGGKQFRGKMTSNLGASYFFTLAKSMNPLVSLDFYIDGKNKYYIEKNILLGIGFGKKTNHFIIGAQYIDGFKKQGMNYNKKMEYIGISMILPFF